MGIKGTNCAIAVTVIGAVLVVTGIAAYFGTSIAIDAQVHALLSVSSEKNIRYDSFIDSSDEDGRPANYSYRFFNITNVAEMLTTGALPKVDVVGPYIYTQQKKKLKVRFENGGRQVSFNEMTYYTYNGGSNISDSDSITMLNWFYYGIQSRLGGPTGLFLALGWLQGLDDLNSGSVGTPDTKFQNYWTTYFSTSYTLEALRDVVFGPAGFYNQTNTPLTNFNNLATFLTLYKTAAGKVTAGSTNIAFEFNSMLTLWPTFFAAMNCNTLPACIPTFLGYPQALAGYFSSQTNVNSAPMRKYIAMTKPTFAPAGPVSPIVTRTAVQWAFGTTDPFRYVMVPLLAGNVDEATRIKLATVAFTTNDTSEDFTLARNVRMTFETGKYNRSLIGQYIEYENQKMITSYPKGVSVTGTTGRTNKMDVKKDDKLNVFVTQISRPLVVVQAAEKVKYNELDLYRYTLEPSELGPKAEFNMRAKGLFDISVLASGMPIILTKSRFLDTDPSLNLAAQWGLSPTFDEDETILDIEPYTGLAMRAHLRLQFNLNISRIAYNTSINKAAAAIDTPFLMPFYLVDNYGEASKKDCDNLSTALKGIHVLPMVLAIIISGIGGVVLICGGICCYRARKHHLEHKRDPTLDETDLKTFPDEGGDTESYHTDRQYDGGHSS